MKKFKIGLLGFGNMGRTHLYSIENLKYYYKDLPVSAAAEWSLKGVKFHAAYRVGFEKASVIYDENGVATEEKINFMLEMRASCRNKVQDYADKFGVQFFPGEKPWGVKVDIAMPCATQNEINMDEAKKLVANGVQYYIEVANMPTTNDALEYLKENVKVVAPSKAVNAGGVAVSALEMGQNSMRYNWTAEEVDAKLRQIMIDIHNNSAAAAEEYGFGYNLVAGANIAGFLKVAEAMKAQGCV